MKKSEASQLSDSPTRLARAIDELTSLRNANSLLQEPIGRVLADLAYVHKKLERVLKGNEPKLPQGKILLFGIDTLQFRQPLSQMQLDMKASLEDTRHKRLPMYATPEELAAMENILKGEMSEPRLGRKTIVVLHQLVSAWGNEISLQELSEKAGYSFTTVNQSVSTLFNIGRLSRWEATHTDEKGQVFAMQECQSDKKDLDEYCAEDDELGSHIDAYLQTLGFSSTPSPKQLFKPQPWMAWRSMLKGYKNDQKVIEVDRRDKNNWMYDSDVLDVFNWVFLNSGYEVETGDVPENDSVPWVIHLNKK